MGKGTIVSSAGEGQYSVQINYDRDRYEKTIATLDANIATLEATIAGMSPDDPEYNIKVLQKTALEKRKSSLQSSFPDDKTISAWCADFTEDLSGVVSTIEVPGESTAIQIAPGYSGASYDPAVNGQLSPTIGQNAFQAMYNLITLPGWQKWMPTFRYGTITSIDEDNCDIALDEAVSSQQALNVNQEETLSSVPIEYMDCNGAVFSEGDTVLIKFEEQDWTKPKVIGFKEEPKPCQVDSIMFKYGDRYMVWDIVNETVLVPDGTIEEMIAAGYTPNYNFTKVNGQSKEISNLNSYTPFSDIYERKTTPSTALKILTNLIGDSLGPYPCESDTYLEPYNVAYESDLLLYGDTPNLGGLDEDVEINTTADSEEGTISFNVSRDYDWNNIDVHDDELNPALAGDEYVPFAPTEIRCAYGYSFKSAMTTNTKVTWDDQAQGEKPCSATEYVGTASSIWQYTYDTWCPLGTWQLIEPQCVNTWEYFETGPSDFSLGWNYRLVGADGVQPQLGVSRKIHAKRTDDGKIHYQVYGFEICEQVDKREFGNPVWEPVAKHVKVFAAVTHYLGTDQLYWGKDPYVASTHNPVLGAALEAMINSFNTNYSVPLNEVKQYIQFNTVCF